LIYSPVEISEVVFNEVLEDTPDVINKTPLESWIYRSANANKDQICGLMTELEY
jgi:glycine cleavage system H lipoate-binding protein